MKKFKKAGLKGLAAVLSLAMLLGAAACGSGKMSAESGESSSDTVIASGQTKIKVANFGGGAGRKWLDEAAARFAERVKDVSYEEGKKGVEFDVTSTTGITCKEMRTKGYDVFFVQSKYADCYAEINTGSVLDITDIVAEEDLSEYGEPGVTIESKIDENYRFAMQGLDGKYYMLPHVQTQSGAYYDVDMFTEKGFYLAKAGEGTAYNCALTGATYYFTGEAGEKTVGNDGVSGTDDDGMPTTLDELVAMCDHISDANVFPLHVSGKHIDYVNYLVEGLWTALAGYEERCAVASHQGAVNYVVGYSDEDIWSGTGIKYPIIEKATLSGSEEGYKAINSAARYYAYAFVELAYQQGWFYDRYQDSSYTDRDAISKFILNGINGIPELGCIMECSYWYNEAETYGAFYDYAILSGTGSKDKKIAYWHMPTAYGKGAEAVTGEANRREETAIDGMTSTAMINGNVAKNAGLERACKDFLKFLSTDKELENFTACNGVVKAMFDYQISDSVLSQLSSYHQTI
ncbi:MAG: hypothetical protein J5836_02175, partial [Clostridia bacterium]|nr:hypothetical protein [Clostridia bacterium]